MEQFDVIVIGGGHAGCEAALASARMGVRTLLLTLDPSKIAEMSCNPSIGGVGKGQLVKELDALGGEMGKNADWTGIHFKRLNTRKGSAVQSSRCQSDKAKYATRMQGVISAQPNLQVFPGEVKDVLIRNGTVVGVKVLDRGAEVVFDCKSAVITAGTFMRAVMHCGEERSEGGRFGEGSSVGLSDQLRDLGFRVIRLKTGTPARLKAGSIDFSKMIVQNPDSPPRKFSFFASQVPLQQVPCHLTFTNGRTHEVIRENLHRSPLFSGQIQGIGPRYCPSIEDKVVKFPEKDRHQLFFEPEGLDTDWIYPNGISTSLPADVQESFVRSIEGCERVEFLRYGYAVEYDCLDPRDLKKTFESSLLEGLFLAGQINGTSGYEEAAAQGLIAGINAALRVQEAPSLVLERTESYIGVMIDDLIRQGVVEPYRMFTSRAEYRLSLREDNADLRLSEYGRRVGLLGDEDYRQLEHRRETLTYYKAEMANFHQKPTDRMSELLTRLGASGISGGAQSLSLLLKRPQVSLRDLLGASDWTPDREIDPMTAETLEVELKYEGYIEIQRQELLRLSKLRDTAIPGDFPYHMVSGLSFELEEKLRKQQPQTLAEAAQISGVTPAALSVLLFHLRQRPHA